jgi:hypothetical protein
LTDGFSLDRLDGARGSGKEEGRPYRARSEGLVGLEEDTLTTLPAYLGDEAGSDLEDSARNGRKTLWRRKSIVSAKALTRQAD